MLTFKKKKSSKYIVYIGWAGMYYTDSINDINNAIWAYGKDNVKYEQIKK